MALYKLDETGEALRVDLNDFAATGRVDETALVLARHDIISHKQLTAFAVDAIKGKYHNGQVLATVVTKLRRITDNDNVPPWETMVVGDDPEYHSGTRAQAMEAHRALVNRTVKDYGGRVLI
jgi:hypothetical protein